MNERLKEVAKILGYSVQTTRYKLLNNNKHWKFEEIRKLQIYYNDLDCIPKIVKEVNDEVVNHQEEISFIHRVARAIDRDYEFVKKKLNTNIPTSRITEDDLCLCKQKLSKEDYKKILKMSNDYIEKKRKNEVNRNKNK